MLDYCHESSEIHRNSSPQWHSHPSYPSGASDTELQARTPTLYIGPREGSFRNVWDTRTLSFYQTYHISAGFCPPSPIEILFSRNY